MDIRSAIVVPLKAEFTRLLGFMKNQGYNFKQYNTGTINVQLDKESGILICIGGHGKVNFAVTTQHLADTFQSLNLIICAGTAGSLDKKLNIGDVVIATSVIEHDYKMKFLKSPLPEIEISSERSKNGVSESTENFAIHYGSIASGDEDITDIKRKSEIKTITDSLCVAWEGIGGAKAAKFSKIPYLEIRTVSDSAESNTPDEFMKNLDRAITNLGTVLLKILL